MKTFKEYVETLDEETLTSGVKIKSSGSGMTIHHPKHGTLKLKYNKNKGTWHHPDHGEVKFAKPFDNENNKTKILSALDKHGTSLGLNK